MSRRGGNAASAALDAMMGEFRNLPLHQQATIKKEEIKWNDTNVCKLHIIGVCPHDLFGNTKFDLPPCRSKHIDSCQVGFSAESPSIRLPFERSWIQYVQNTLIRPCDQRVTQGKERVASTARENGLTTEAELKKLCEAPEIVAIDTQAAEITKNIAVLQAQIEEMKKVAASATTTTPATTDASPAAAPTETTAATASAPDAATDAPTPATGATSDAAPAPAAAASAPVISAPAAALQKLIDGLLLEKVNLDIKKNDLLKAMRPAPTATPTPAALASSSSASLQRNMRVCEVCASLLRIDETEERLQDHRAGKVHASFAAIRDKANQLQEQHKASLAAGDITEAQLRGPINIPTAGPPQSSNAPADAPYPPRQHQPPHQQQHYDQRWGGHHGGQYQGGGQYHGGGGGGGWHGGRGGGYGGGHGGGHGGYGGGYGGPAPYQYGRPVAPRDGGRDDRRHDSSRSSRRDDRSRHSRSRSRDRSSSRSRKHHKRSHRSRSPSESRSRSRERKSSRRHRSKSRSRSRSRSRDRKSHKSHRSDRDRKRRSRSRSRSRQRSESRTKKEEADNKTTTTTATLPTQVDSFTTPL